MRYPILVARSYFLLSSQPQANKALIVIVDKKPSIFPLKLELVPSTSLPVIMPLLLSHLSTCLSDPRTNMPRSTFPSATTSRNGTYDSSGQRVVGSCNRQLFSHPTILQKLFLPGPGYSILAAPITPPTSSSFPFVAYNMPCSIHSYM